MTRPAAWCPQPYITVLQFQGQHWPAAVAQQVDQDAVQFTGPEVETKVKLVAQFDGVR